MRDVESPAVRQRPSVRVVVVNYRGTGVTERCIEALLADDLSAVDLAVVVVDNSPGDGVCERIRSAWPQVEVRSTGRNEGFARGCNLALTDLDGLDAVALVNNDALVQRGWLAPLLGSFADPAVGAASPKILLNLWACAVVVDCGDAVGAVALERVEVDGVDIGSGLRFDERWAGNRPVRLDACAWWPVSEGTGSKRVRLTLSASAACEVRIGSPRDPHPVHLLAGINVFECESSEALRIVNSAGGGLYEGWLGGDIGFLEPDLGQHDTPSEVFGWCGGAVLLRADYLRDVGVFDPSMFVYYEDFDLACRGRARGWRHAYAPSSVVLHEHGWSSRGESEQARFWNDRNRRIAVLKNAPPRAAVRAVAGSIRSGPLLAWSIARAMPATLIRRCLLRRRAAVRPHELERWMTVR